MMERVIDFEIGGILGYDFLSRFVTQIDYERKLISFFEPDSFEPTAPGTVLEAPLMHNVFSVECMLDKNRSGSFLLDTGANSSMLQRHFVEKHDLASGKQLLDIAILGAGGEQSASLCRFNSLSLGGHLLKNPVFAIPSETSGIGAFEGVSGIIGNDVLERFRITLNYRKQWVFLEPNRRIDDPFYPDKGGLQIARSKDGSVIVYSVIPGSPAEKAGVKPGDEIVSIDGRESSSFDNLDEVIHVFQDEEGDRRELEIKRNGRRMELSILLKSYL
jgi:hypothetical protein